MSLRDRAPLNYRPRWPAQFDIEGIPRDPETREREKLLRQNEEPAPMPQNEFDINKPPREPYVHQDYPHMLYKGTERRVVPDAAAEKKALAEGFSRTADGKKLMAERARENRKAHIKPAPSLEDETTDKAEGE